MIFHLNSENGHIQLFGLTITWGNHLSELDLPGFFTIGAGSLFIEAGDVDQGRPGLYLTRYIDGDPYTVAKLWSL